MLIMTILKTEKMTVMQHNYISTTQEYNNL